MKLQGIGKAGRANLGRVLANNPAVITSTIVSDSLDVTREEAQKLLARWCKSGWLSRIKQGAYVALPLEASSDSVVLENPLIIADSLYNPGYVGGFSAVKYWDFSEQIIETEYYFTTKQVRNLKPVLGDTQFRLKTIQPYKVFATKPLWYGAKKVLISDPSKTIVDLLDDPRLVGGMSIVLDIFKEYGASDHCDYEKLLSYATTMQNKTILKRLGFMIDTKCDQMPAPLMGMERNLSAGYSRYDTTVQCPRTVDKWKLKVPVSWKDEYDRKKRSNTYRKE